MDGSILDVLRVPWVAWGVLPFVAVNVGFWTTALLLELVLRRVLRERPTAAGRSPRWLSWRFWFTPVEYGRVSREAAVARSRSQVPVGEQLRGAALQICGPAAILGAAASGLLMPLLMPTPSADWPSAAELAVQVAVMEVAGDFLLYCGHRIQHESEYLWSHFHHLHHRVGAPTPLTTLYIDGVDATLQATLPLLGAACVARPHPLSFSAYCLVRVGQNTLNHCGMESPLLSLLALRFVPGRASAAFHDHHHRHSNYSRNAKNYGENFWIWDAAFGTASRAPASRR